MKTYFELLICIQEAMAAPVAVPVGKRSWSQLSKEIGGRKPSYANIGHTNVDPKQYSIFGIKKSMPYELWWTDDGSTIKRKKATKDSSDEFLMHGTAGQTGAGGYLKTVGGDMSRYKGRIDHERKAISVAFGGAADDGSMLRLRALEKGVGNIIRKLKQLYPDYGVHYWDADGKVQST